MFSKIGALAVDELEGRVKVALQPYLQMIEALTAGRVSATDFTPEYMTRYLNDSTMWPNDVFRLLDGLFAEADSYVADPALRADVIQGISGEELLLYATEVHKGLNALLARGLHPG